jgi:5'-3' exonuclease
MGIPFLYQHLVRRHPQIVVSAPPACQRLLLDFNSLIHAAARDVMALIPASASAATFETAVCTRVVELTRRLVAQCPPSELLFIAVDGVPPLAKMAQQRRRRYMTALVSELQPSPMVWDTNAISPGTRFMRVLAAHLSSHLSIDAAGAPWDFVLSDSEEPGEGEHKIMALLRSLPGSGAAGVNVVYGLDADLLLLSLVVCATLPTVQICLMRDSPGAAATSSARPTPWDSAAFAFVDVGVLSAAVAHSVLDTPPVSDAVCRALVMDYVALLAFVGNDFLPHLSFLSLHFRHSLQELLRAYRRAAGTTGRYLISPEAPHEVDVDFLGELLAALGEAEDACMATFDAEWYDCRPRPALRGRNACANTLDAYPLLHKTPNIVQPQKPGWRQRYYRQVLGIEDVIAVSEVCASYLEGLHWLAAYYFHGRQTSDWAYQHPFYGPCVQDLHAHLVGANAAPSAAAAPAKAVTPAVTPALQLMLILPRASLDLVDPSLRPLMTDVTHGCVHLYPLTFNLLTYGKRHLWECVPKLPAVDAMLVRRAVAAATQTSPGCSGPRA